MITSILAKFMILGSVSLYGAETGRAYVVSRQNMITSVQSISILKDNATISAVEQVPPGKVAMGTRRDGSLEFANASRLDWINVGMTDPPLYERGITYSMFPQDVHVYKDGRYLTVPLIRYAITTVRANPSMRVALRFEFNKDSIRVDSFGQDMASFDVTWPDGSPAKSLLPYLAVAVTDDASYFFVSIPKDLKANVPVLDTGLQDDSASRMAGGIVQMNRRGAIRLIATFNEPVSESVLRYDNLCLLSDDTLAVYLSPYVFVIKDQ